MAIKGRKILLERREREGKRKKEKTVLQIVIPFKYT